MPIKLSHGYRFREPSVAEFLDREDSALSFKVQVLGIGQGFQYGTVPRREDVLDTSQLCRSGYGPRSKGVGRFHPPDNTRAVNEIAR